MKEIEDLRKKIDEVDENIKKLLIERMELVNQVGIIKKDSGILIEDKNREEEIINSVTKDVDDRYKDIVGDIFKEIIKLSKSFQNQQ